MYRTLRIVAGGIVIAATAVGCSQSANKSVAQATSATETVAKTTASAAGTSLASQLGGMSMVTQLADAFGVNIAADPTLSKSFDAPGVTAVKNGLVNDVAKASGMAPPNGTTDLLSALSGKGLDATGVSALNSALTAAAEHVHLNPAQTSALTTLVSPIFAKLAP